MKIPCAEPLSFIVTGLSFLQPALTNIQFDNLTLIATALVLGSKFNLTEISRMWLKEKSVSTLSYLLSDAKFYIPTKTATVRLNSILGKHRIIESKDPVKQTTAEKLSKESLTIPSIVRQAQYENLKAIVGRIQHDKGFIPMWLAIEEKNINRKRKKNNAFITLGQHQDEKIKLSA